MSRFLVIAVIGLMAGGLPCAAQDTFEVRGSVRELDAKVGTITIDISNSKPHTYSLASADLPVRDARDNPMKLQDVKPGQKISLSIVSASNVAAIKILPSFKVGKIIHINAETRELDLLVKKEKLRFKLAKDAHYIRSERIVAPRDFRLGDRISVYYLAEKNEVIMVTYRNLKTGS